MTDHEPKTIVVTGKGTAYVAPDVTRVIVSVRAIGRTYPQLYELAQQNLKELSKIVTDNGLSSKLPKTQRFEIEKKEEPKYDEFGNFLYREFVGYELEQQIKIDLPMDNKLLSKIVQTIGTSLVDAEIKIGYTVKDSRPAELRMLEKAVKDATEKAQIMAKAAGCSLGLVQNIHSYSNQVEFYSQVRSMAPGEGQYADSSSLDINPDDLAGVQEVSVTWYLSNNVKGKE
jgi:uncharacterized protein YggE